MTLQFVTPSMDYIPSFIDSLKEGDFTHMAMANFGDAAAEEVEKAPEVYLQKLNDKSARKIETPNGHTFMFYDHFITWVVDETNRFIAGISFRFDNNELINTYCGHAGMSVRPALLNKGYGVKIAHSMYNHAISTAKTKGLKCFLASANPDNPASYRLVENLGGKLIAEHDPYGFGITKLYKKNLEGSVG